MNLKSVLCACVAAIYLIAADKAEACTNVIVTPGAGKGRSSMVSYAADSHWLFGELYFRKAANWTAGSPLKINEWDTGRYLGEISQVAHTYKTVGNMNEHQLIIGETTFGGRHELADKNGIMDYGSLIYITLQRAATAREAIEVMTSLVSEYGYYSEGETFSIADKNEAWIMEMVGKGENGHGALWVARRIPDGYICAHANQARITTFPLNDPENCLYAPDVISFAREKGWFDGPDEEFSFADAYCPLDFSGMRGCEGRVWSAFNIAGKGKFTYENEAGEMVTEDAYKYLDYAMGHNAANRMPLWILPAEEMSVKDVADIMRDHYEGTPMDMTQDIGAGGNALPYRWRPMTFKWEGKHYVNERAIATQQTGFWFVGQARTELPDIYGGIIWFGTDDAATSYVTPIYTNTDECPDCFREGNGDLLAYSPTASFWINNRVANACYKMYNYMGPFVREYIDKFENTQLAAVEEIDAKAAKLYAKAAKRMARKAKKNKEYNPLADTTNKKIRKLLTRYSVTTAQDQFNTWRQMEETLLVKFIDGNVKAQNEDGSFKRNEEGLAEGLEQPGYTDFWKEAVAKFHGEVAEIK